MLSWYRRIRLAAYACFAAGLLAAIFSRGGNFAQDKVLQTGFGLLILAFILLLASQGLWVVLKLRQYRPTVPRTETTHRAEPGSAPPPA